MAPQVPLSSDGRLIKSTMQFDANVSFILSKRKENTQRASHLCADLPSG